MNPPDSALFISGHPHSRCVNMNYRAVQEEKKIKTAPTIKESAYVKGCDTRDHTNRDGKWVAYAKAFRSKREIRTDFHSSIHN